MSRGLALTPDGKLKWEGTRARGVHKPGILNATEERYATHLELLKRAGEVEWYAFEAVTLKLAKDTRYTPDFFVMRPGGWLECHEVKGFFREDAKVKMKVAAANFPFRFIAVRAQLKRDGGGWSYEEF
jgi:hypothetical protein